jgi:hypothetical protein
MNAVCCEMETLAKVRRARRRDAASHVIVRFFRLLSFMKRGAVHSLVILLCFLSAGFFPFSSVAFVALGRIFLCDIRVGRTWLLIQDELYTFRI